MILNFYEVRRFIIFVSFCRFIKFKILVGIPIKYRTKDFQNSTYKKCPPLKIHKNCFWKKQRNCFEANNCCFCFYFAHRCLLLSQRWHVSSGKNKIAFSTTVFLLFFPFLSCFHYFSRLLRYALYFQAGECGFVMVWRWNVCIHVQY